MCDSDTRNVSRNEPAIKPKKVFRRVIFSLTDFLRKPGKEVSMTLKPEEEIVRIKAATTLVVLPRSATL